MSYSIIGLDIGGTNLRIGAVNAQEEVVASKICESEIVSKADDPIKTLGGIIQDFIADNHIENVRAVSIGVPSSVANDSETVICTTNMKDKSGKPVFQNTNIASSLMEEINYPVFVNNDTSNILIYDVFRNHLQDKRMVIGIYIGTGVGASVLIDGKLMKGADGVALDLGHIPYYKGEDPCSCGKSGCCECYASGWKLQQIRSQYYPDEDIKTLYVNHAGDEPLQEFLYSCSHVFSVMATIFNPDTVIAGGGVLEMESFPREQFEQLVKKNTGLDVMGYGFDLLFSKSNAEKGIVGAAIFAERMMKDA